jgi:hypothetical protein
MEEHLLTAHRLGWSLSGKFLDAFRICIENSTDIELMSELLEKWELGDSSAISSEGVQTDRGKIASKKREFDAQVARKYAAKYADANARNIQFDLSFSDMKRLLKQKTCFYTGVELSEDVGGNKFTLDRIDSAKGYVKGNVWIVSHRANRIKGDATSGELIKIGLALQGKVF